MSIFKGLFKSRDKPKNSYDSPSYTYFFGRSSGGKRVTDRTALQHIAVYACVRVLSEAIAQLPLHVYKYNDHGKERVPQHPLYFLLHDQPNSEMTSFNDIREMEDMNMISAEEGGDLYLCNGSFTKLSNTGAFYEQKGGDNSDETSGQ